MSEVETIEPIETNLLQNLLVLTYLLIITVVIRFPYFFPAVIDWDESTQIIMGQNILDGQLPYIDLWDNKPPLSFLSYAFFILFLGKSIIGIRLAGSICVVTTAYLIYIVARNIWNNRSGIISATLFIVFASLMGNGQATMTEIVAIVPLISSMTILIIKKETPFSFYLAGLLIGISGFIRLNLAYVGILILIAIFINLIRQKDKMYFYQLVTFILGGVTIIAVSAFPYLYTGHIKLFFNSVFLAPYYYSTSQNSMVGSAALLIVKGFGCSNIILWLGFFAGIIWTVKNSRYLIQEKRKKIILIFLFLLGTSFSIVKSGAVFSHHVIQIVPFMALLSGVSIDVLFSSKFRFYIIVALLIGLILPLKTIITKYPQMAKKWLEKETFFDHAAYEIDAYLQIVNTERKPVYLMTDNIVYWFADMKPLTKLSTHPSNISKDFLLKAIAEPGASAKSEIIKILNKRPEFIVKKEDTWYLRKNKGAKDFLMASIRKEYELVKMIRGRQIFRRKN